MYILKKIAVTITSLLFLLFMVISISGCNETTPIIANKILSQIPDNKRLVLVPGEIFKSGTENYKVISFDEIVLMQKKDGHTYDEVEFYIKSRSLGVQYILISSEMTGRTNPNFPWMINKNFRVCPGNVDHKSQRYYTLLVWDNSKNSYHFFKFLYENNK